MLPAALLAVLVTCLPPVTLCDGSPLLHQEQVTFAWPFLVRGMVTSPACPLGEAGEMQACATVVSRGEWATLDCALPLDLTPDPEVGEVYDVQMPVAVNWAGRSDGCAP